MTEPMCPICHKRGGHEPWCPYNTSSAGATSA